jgi:hypothetical protein
LPNDEYSTPKYSSSGKRRRIRSLRNGQRRSRRSRHDPVAVDVVVETPDSASLPEGAGIVRREIVFDNNDVDSAWEVNAPTLNSPLAHADYTRGLSANRTDHLYNTEVDENDESTECSETANPPFDSLVESPSATRAITQAFQSDALYEKYRNPVTRIEVMMDPVNLIALIFACGTVRFTKARYEQVRRFTWMISKLSHNEMKLPCYTTLKRKVEFVVLKFAYAGSTFHSFPSCSRLATASRSNAALSIEGSLSDGRCFQRVVIVGPSEWALLDVSTGPINSLMYGREEKVPDRTTAIVQTIEYYPIVRSRNAIMNCDNIFFAAQSSGGNPGEQALPIAMSASDYLKITLVPSSIFMRFVERENFGTARNGTHVSLNAVVASVDVHGLNLAANSPGGEQWIASVESELGAGDSVVVLRAGKNAERRAQATRLLLIHRFWKRNSSEYRVFLAIASNSSEFTSSTDCSGSTKARVKLVEAVANSDRTLEGYGPNSPCKGFIENGDPYIVYSMLLLLR